MAWGGDGLHVLLDTHAANRLYEYVTEAKMNNVAQFFKVLADEARLKMLWLLFSHGELCVCDIMETLGITQSKASRHLATLRHAGLVTDRKVGAWSYYSLRPVENGFIRAQLETLRTSLTTHPSAAGVLGDLTQWLERKDHGAACPANSAPRTPRERSRPAARDGCLERRP